MVTHWNPGRLNGRYCGPLSLGGMAFLIASPFVWAHSYDLYSYWMIDLAHPYATIHGLTGVGPFRYAPPLALMMAPLRLLSFEALQVLWLALQLAALWYIGRSWFLALILFPPVWLDIVYGNINIFLGAAIVAGFRHPQAWAFPLLTKVTPGVGVLWFAFRRQWRNLAIALATVATVALASVLVQGIAVWSEWFDSLILSNQLSGSDPGLLVPIPIVPRVMVAAALLAFAGRTNRPWLVPVAVAVAMPSIWPISFAPLVALWDLRLRPATD